MFVFCLSLGLSEDSQRALKPITDGLYKTAEGCEAFLHTSVFQGVSQSMEGLLGWFLSGESVINQIKTKNALSLWDKCYKGIEGVYIEGCDSNLSAICLSYKYANFLSYLSISLGEELELNQLLLSFSDINTLYLEGSENKPLNIINALDYQYKAKVGLVRPHTTLGFSKNPFEDQKKFEQELRLSYQSNLYHDGIYLTCLDELCMTPTANRKMICTFL